MSALRVVLVASLIATGLAVPLGAAPTAASDVGSLPRTTGALQADVNNTSQTPVGAQISGFMQQQTAQTDGAVETGMWSGAYENSADGSGKAALVTERTQGLAADVAALQAERRELIAARQAGNITALEFQSRMSGLAGQYASVMSALEETEPRAEEAGADVATIADFRGAATKIVGAAVVDSTERGILSPSDLANETTVGPPIEIPGQENETGTEIGTGLLDDPTEDETTDNGTLGIGNGDDGGDGTIGIGIGDSDGNESDGGDGIDLGANSWHIEASSDASASLRR